MAPIEPVEEAAAQGEAKDPLKELRGRSGESWNISGALAHNPPVLAAFMALNQALDRSGLSPHDREVICLELARANGCHYCVPAHRYVSHQVGLDPTLVERLANTDLDPFLEEYRD